MLETDPMPESGGPSRTKLLLARPARAVNACAMDADPYRLVVPASFLLGGAAGYVMHRGDFCIAGMFRDLFLFRRAAPLKALLLAVCLSMAGFEGARALGLLGAHPFPLLGTASLANVLGGLVFGIGMVLAGGCVVGCLYKLGAGSVLGLVTLVGLVGGSALYAEIHPWWSSVARSGAILGTAVTVPQALNLAPWVLLAPLLVAAVALLAGWLGRGELSCDVHPEGYLQPWQTATLLAVVGLLSYLLVGMPLGITTAYAKAAAFVELWLAPGHVEELAYYRVESLSYVPPFSEIRVSGGPGPRLDAVAAVQFPLILGIVGGASASAVLLREFHLRVRLPWRQYLSAFVGGILMGLAARAAPACNVWHLLGGLPILALQSLLFIAGMVPGAWLGSRLVARLVLR